LAIFFAFVRAGARSLRLLPHAVDVRVAIGRDSRSGSSLHGKKRQNDGRLPGSYNDLAGNAGLRARGSSGHRVVARRGICRRNAPAKPPREAAWPTVLPGTADSQA
jgi:hypothetical protein